MSKSSVFSVVAGLIIEVLFMLIMLCNGPKIAEYEAYYIMSFPLINASWGARLVILWPLFLLKRYARVHQL